MCESSIGLGRQMEIDSLRYYQGFKVGMDKVMFEQEINDAKAMYQEKKDDAIADLQSVNYSLTHYMREFIQLNEIIQESDKKLAELEYKLNGGK